MSDIAIRVENLSKLYHIGMLQQRHDTLRDALTGMFRRSNQSTNPQSINSHSDELWALRDVSFEVKRGEVVGIIGRNGAGKSTLLKILSRITEPTSGRVELHGRVGSLLEVGTGFHPELTGRENIYLNGAILGMHRVEIDRQFDEIVAFAEIERFLDTPVKRYSSGMYVRLAFAVAAHLEPEILLVDEVLAVGDAQFQKKCLGKMGDIAKEGRTVIFVSHNLGAMTQLCSSALLLSSGTLSTKDQTAIVVQTYLNKVSIRSSSITINPEKNPDSPMVLIRCWIADLTGQCIQTVNVVEDFVVGLSLLVRKQSENIDVGVRFYNSNGQPLFTCSLSDTDISSSITEQGEHSVLLKIPKLFLAPDTYSLTVGIHKPGVKVLDSHEHLISFRVVESGSHMWQYSGQGYGSLLVRLPWQVIY